jgi:mannan endo-1,4-beta-mannosidase
MAEAIKSGLNGSQILTTNGGGAYLDNSLLDAYFTCGALDVLSIHAYGTGDFTTSKLQPYVSKAKSKGKKLIMEEWGVCYFSSANNRCDKSSVLSSSTRDSNIKTWAANFDSVGLPWFYWQILPNEDPHSDWDYEVGINGKNWDVLKTAAQAASKANAAFDFSAYLL